MANFCRYCGGKLNPGEKFCGGCGQKIVSPKIVSPDISVPSAKAEKPKKKRGFTITINILLSVAMVAECLVICFWQPGFFRKDDENTRRDKPDKVYKAGKIVEAEASGTVSNGIASVTFSESGGMVALIESKSDIPDNAISCFDLVLDKDASTNITLSIDEPKTKDGFTSRITLGLPYRDINGDTGYLNVPLETEHKEGKMFASLDLIDYADVAGDFMFTGSSGYEDDIYDAGRRITSAGDLKSVKGKMATRWFSENVFTVPSDGGHFSVNIPEKMFNDDTVPKKGKLMEQDALDIGNDMESILAEYRKDFPKETRTKWPIDVENLSDPDADGGYGGGIGARQNGNYFSLKLTKLTDGYKSKGSYVNNPAIGFYHTLCHEVFHFIQAEYTNKGARSLWFDEAMAVYYEDVKGDSAGADHSSNAYCEKYSNKKDGPTYYNAVRQFDGMTPSSTFFVSGDSSGNDGYGRRPMMEYLMTITKGKFIPDMHPNYTVASSGEPVEALITKYTGKTMPELTRDYYDNLVAKGSLDSLYTNPWDLYLGSYDGGGLNLRELGFYTRFEPKKGLDDTCSFTLPRYGVHFIALDPQYLPAEYDRFSISPETEGTTLVLMDIFGDEYAKTKVWRSWEGAINEIPIKGHSYLIMVINETTSHYSGGMTGGEAKISVRFHSMNEGADGTFPDIKQIPAEYEGTASFRELTGYSIKSYSYYEKKVTAKLNPDPDTACVHVSVKDEAGKEIFVADMSYDPESGSLTSDDGRAQLEAGDKNGLGSSKLRIYDLYGTGSIYASYELTVTSDITPFLGQYYRYEDDKYGFPACYRIIITEKYVRMPFYGLNYWYFDSYEIKGNTLIVHWNGKTGKSYEGDPISEDFTGTGTFILTDPDHVTSVMKDGDDEVSWKRVPPGQESDDPFTDVDEN